MKENDLIQTLQQGDELETERMIQQHYSNIYSFLYRRCHNVDLAKDLTQETFYRFFRNIHQYEAKGKLLNYLYRIALHLFYDEARKQKHITNVCDMGYILDNRPTPEESIRSKQNTQDIRMLLQTLSSHQQDVLILRFYHELKFKDIAKITGMNVSTVKSRYRTALTTLEQKWKEGETYVR